jgi:hypothetical protein
MITYSPKRVYIFNLHNRLKKVCYRVGRSLIALFRAITYWPPLKRAAPGIPPRASAFRISS